MARLYADEQFPRLASELLRNLGHDVLTVQEAGNANLGIPDDRVLAFAVANNRAIVTLNRKDFMRLHMVNSEHFGIIVCTNDRDRTQLANQIDRAIAELEFLQGKLIRIIRPANPIS
jgi:predicted nuclease of predicted toxin-antitoxin system